MALYVGEGLGREQYHFLGSRPVSSHFPYFLYMISTLLAAALVLNPRVGGFAYILGPRGSFVQILMRDWSFLPLPQIPLICIARIYEALFLVLETWAMQSGLGLGWLALQVSLPVFIYHT